jgi:pyruvate dehydrogenase E1 component beta subunit
VYIDHKRLFPLGGQVPDEETLVPLGSAAVRREGRHLTLVAHSYTSLVTIEAANLLAKEGIEAEVIDLRSVWPIDWNTLEASVRRTGHLLTVEEGQEVCGVGTEIAFELQQRVAGLRVARLGARRMPVSASPVLESYALPDAQRIAESARRLLRLAPRADVALTT